MQTQRLVDTVGEERVGCTESNTDLYTLPCVKQIQETAM